MQHKFLGFLACSLMFAGCSNKVSTDSGIQTSAQNSAPSAQIVKLTPQQELAKYCRVCVVDKGEKIEEYLPSRLDTKIGGKIYKFCTDDCKKKFDADEEKYALK